MDKATMRWNKIEVNLKTHDCIMNADVCAVQCFGGNSKSDSGGSDNIWGIVRFRKGGHWVYNKVISRNIY